jgi:protein SCO1/2
MISGRKSWMCGLSVAALQVTLAAQATPPAQNHSPAHTYFSDVALLDQNGKQQRLYSDLLQGKIVVVNSFFATCKDSCPVMERTFAKIQETLGDRIGKDVYLLSLTVDPETDTPERLKAYAQQMKARPGWFFLTGTKENVNYALGKFGLYTEDKQNHLTMFLIGNEPTGLWKKTQGTASAGDLIRIVQTVLDDHPTEGARPSQ